MSHRSDYRVYYSDTDAGGVVYHANYLTFCEKARTDFIIKEGYKNSDVIREFGAIFVVRHMDLDYLKAVFLEDEINVETSILEVRNSSVVFQQNIYRGDDLVFTAKVSLVCVNKESVRPVRIPQVLKEKFTAHLVVDPK